MTFGSSINKFLFFKVENNSLELTRIFQNIFIDPIVSARKKTEKRGRHEEREKERKRRFGVNAIISHKFLPVLMSTILRKAYFFLDTFVDLCQKPFSLVISHRS